MGRIYIQAGEVGLRERQCKVRAQVDRAAAISGALIYGRLFIWILVERKPRPVFRTMPLKWRRYTEFES